MASATLPYRQPAYRKIGGWLPQNNKVVVDWLKGLLEEIDSDRRSRKGLEELGPEVKALKKTIEDSAELRMLAQAMLDEVPNKPPYNEDPVGTKQIKKLDDLYACFQRVMTSKAPIWRELEYEVGLVGFPFNAVLDWPMATPSGYAFFLKSEINDCFKCILDTWKDKFLNTIRSAEVLVPDEGPGSESAWLGPKSREIIEKDTNLEGEKLTFAELFECFPDQDYWGFKSWDDFFIRVFRNYDIQRPIAFPMDDHWIINSCESKPFSLQAKVKDYDKFWLKGQPYSVMDMLDHQPKYAKDFVGGTIYQAFLSATSYHRWDSPVRGIVRHSEVINGTYFAAPVVTGFHNPDGPDPASPDLAQGYITHFATRAIFYIEIKDIGIIALIYVGMADVSSCQILEEFQQENLPAPVIKGQELGMFHHGGSTHCLLLPKTVHAAFIPEASPREGQRNIPIRSKLAYIYHVDK